MPKPQVTQPQVPSALTPIAKPNLYQMVYVSHITSKGLLQLDLLNQIAKASVANNQALGIVGMLYYDQGSFFQCLEGSEQALTDLKNTLLVDRRHQRMRLLDFSAISEPRFVGHTMLVLVSDPWRASNEAVFVPELPELAASAWQNGAWVQLLEVMRSCAETINKERHSDTLQADF